MDLIPPTLNADALALQVSLSNHLSCFWPPLSLSVFRMADLAIGRWLQRMRVAVAGSISVRRE